VVGGYTYNPGSYHTGDPLIVKFDKDGTFLWSRNPGGPYQDGIAMVCLNNDSSFMLVTAIADSIYIPDFDYARICVIKYSMDGEELWRKKYGASVGGNFVFNIKPLAAGGCMCCGEQNFPGNYNVYRSGWLLRINNDGDSLWFRRYTYSEDIPFYYNGLHDVSLCADGGFFATGEVWDDGSSNGLQKIWILKVDSIGCEFEGCDSTVGIEEGRTVGLYDDKKGGLEIWPNPARDRLTVSGRRSAVNGEQSNFNIMIYDCVGRLIKETNNLSSFPVNMDISHLYPGIYFVVVRDERSVIGSGKFVVAW
jgi:hypothetical protein